MHLKRSRTSLGSIQLFLTELDYHHDGAEQVLICMCASREIVEELADKLDRADEVEGNNPLLPDLKKWEETTKAFLSGIPEDTEQLAELIQAAMESAQDYENSLDEHDLTADTREELWGDLINNLENIAEALDPAPIDQAR